MAPEQEFTAPQLPGGQSGYDQVIDFFSNIGSNISSFFIIDRNWINNYS